MHNHLLIDGVKNNWVLADSEDPDEVVKRLDQARKNEMITHVNAVVPEVSDKVLIVSVDPSKFSWWTVAKDVPDPRKPSYDVSI